MASKRKWRAESELGVNPFPSKAAVYRYVNGWRKAYRTGDRTVTRITVRVDEYGDGRWHVYERLDFAEELRSEFDLGEVPDAG